MTGRAPSSRLPLLALGASVIVVAAVVVALTLGGDGGDGGGDGPAAPGDLTGACQSLHAGHNVMAWDPTMADAMVAEGCPWPYEPFLTSLEGGEEDPAFDAAPFEPRAYDELWTVIGDAGLGICSVGALPEDPGGGFVFGFRYSAGPPGCPGATATVELVAREYGTRAQRDAAAGAGADDGDVVVLGRWVLTVTGDEPADRAGLVSGLVELGGVGA